MRTVIARTERGAMSKFMREYDPEPGRYWIKERGVGDWTEYSVR